MKLCQVKTYPALCGSFGAAMGVAFAALLLVAGCGYPPINHPLYKSSAGLTGGDLPPCPGAHEGSTAKWSDCYGTISFTNGDKYVGEFKDGHYHGHGTAVAGGNGNKYVGEFRVGKYHGHGTVTFPNGDNYVGEVKDDKYHGHGTLTWANGDKYVGEWRYGKRHGQGTGTFGPSSQFAGNKYVGEWRDDKMHGHATGTFATGNKYVGGFRENLMHGQGTFLWPNGSQYEGKFKGDKPHGQGTYTFADIGKVAEGIWENGCLKEFCIYELMAK